MIAQLACWVRTKEGRQRELLQGCHRAPPRPIIATGNERHVKRPGLRVFNPFRELS